MRKILVTSALPYANGPIHLGHILEQIQTDVWVRWQKLNGNNCIFVCGDDAHGTPVMLSANKLGVDPEELVKDVKVEHERDFKGFYIDFDNYYTTHSKENFELSKEIYEKLYENGDIETSEIEQLYDPVANMFLPDRFVKGTCPKCLATNQYGDNCEVCSATYSTVDLIDPVSTVSEEKPIKKSSLHYFFRLYKYEDMLKKWVSDDKHLQVEVSNKLNEWLSTGLKRWDISRDAPYFGFEIPNAKGKYFYVWLDAPIGYIASFKNLCSRREDINFEEYWNADSETELYHFVGKDIIYFHALFWPAILHGSNFRKPNSIFAHGFVTVNGKKMSKSKGTFIKASDYLKYLNPEYLRYYFSSKLSNNIEDIDLNFDDFIKKINSDLVGKVINIASRSAKFINNNFNNLLSDSVENNELFKEFIESAIEIGQMYENRNYNRAVKKIMYLADRANKYIDERKPWNIAKKLPNDLQVQKICTTGLNLFRLLLLYLKPILPDLVKEAEAFLKISPLSWEDRNTLLLNHEINIFKPLMQRVDPKKIDELLSAYE